MMDPGIFAATFAALYVGHHVGDYWVQTDHDAKHKGDAGTVGRIACTLHVMSYLATQAAALLAVTLAAGIDGPAWPVLLGLAVSGLTHYTADRREHGLMFWLARRIPGKAAFLQLGVPREPWGLKVFMPCSTCQGRGWLGAGAYSELCTDCFGQASTPETLTWADNPSLGTGAWALDQSWHLFFGVFVPAMIIAWS